MFTASVSNTNLLIFSTDTITGVNTNYLFVFDNNVFKGISTYIYHGNNILLTLDNSVKPNGTTKVAVYPGGITTTVSSLTTTFLATNTTIFIDNNLPSLYEMMESGDYNYSSNVYSNYISGITTQANFPTASLTLKRNAPAGNITINEGFLGSMRVHRFAALSTTIFSVAPSGILYSAPRNFTFDYNSYGNQLLRAIVLSIQPTAAFKTNSSAYITVNQDYYGTPSPIIVGVSTTVNMSDFAVNQFTDATFGFSSSLNLSAGKYWIIFTPTVDSSLSSGSIIKVKQSTPNNYYSGNYSTSSDGIAYPTILGSGIAFTSITERGMVLPTSDIVYNQLSNPQPITVEYGDSNNLNLFTSLAVPNTAHYIQKGFLDSTQVYAIETLIDSLGQNQYIVSGSVGVGFSSYFSMIANSLTTNINRYDLYTPVTLSNLRLESAGDYYAQSPLGTVLISANDFLGISTIEISTSADFPSSGTTTINPSGSPQQYIANVSYDFGDLGKKFSIIKDKIGSPIRSVFTVINSGLINYLIISDCVVYLYDNIDTVTTLYTLTQSNFTTYTLGANGIILTDTLGNIYQYSSGSITLIGSVSPVPLSSATQQSTTYIGVGTEFDTQLVSNRKRIYSLSSGSVTHQSWSTQIPEPEITALYSTSFGLIIGSYDENRNISKIYSYYNSVLTTLYSGSMRPDVIFFSTQTSTLYVGFSGSEILTAKLSSGVLGSLMDVGLNVVGDYFIQINSTSEKNKIIALTNTNSYIFDEINYVITSITPPKYSNLDQSGLLTTIEALDLNLSKVTSSYVAPSFSNVNYDPVLNGYTSTFRYTASGFIVFNDIPSTGMSTNFCLNLPSNTTLESIYFDNRSISTTIFSGIFYSSIPKSFSFTLLGAGVTGIGTIALYNGLNTSFPVVGMSSLTPVKNLSWFLSTGGENDAFGCLDGSLRGASIRNLSSNTFRVYARFTDIVGNTSVGSGIATDVIYSQIQQQMNNQALPSGRIVEINPQNDLTSFTPAEGSSGFIFSGKKIIRAKGIYESDPFYAADVTSWEQIQVLALIPGVTPATATDEHGTSVRLYVKTAYDALSLSRAQYHNSYEISTINNGNDYTTSVASILANITSLSGPWLQFKLVLISASVDVSPDVQSVLITYNGAGKSVFVSKTFNTATQSTITPAPQIRRGIFTANYVTNGGILEFGYTTDPNEGNPSNYFSITPNQVFTLPSPSSTIKFGVILKTATSNPCFFDSWAVQLDLGPDDLYFMPPQAFFEIQPYYNSSGVAVTRAYQFVNKSIGIVSSYNWSFGTSAVGILTYYPPNEDLTLGVATNRQNPIVQFTNTGPFTIGLFITGFVENNVFYNSELYTKSFIAT